MCRRRKPPLLAMMIIMWLASAKALNDELRRQIAQRSRELVEVLQTRPSVGLTPLREGDTVDSRYRVVKQLGAGAMGAVLEVERISDKKRFALKLVADQSVSGAQRLAREAEIAATLSHRNLVSIVDVGVERAGSVFLVMELVRGGSLEDRRGDFGRLPDAMAFLRDIAAGLAALHERGVVHRDLKPANVLIERSDQGDVAKIADFGISKLDESGAVDAVAATQAASARLTATGALVGTPLHMAPELARGSKATSPAVDVFAFGVLAHEVLTGRYPYELPPVFAALGHAPIPTPPPPEGAPAPLARLIAACLDPDPQKRPSARDLAQAFS